MICPVSSCLHCRKRIQNLFDGRQISATDCHANLIFIRPVFMSEGRIFGLSATVAMRQKFLPKSSNCQKKIICPHFTQTGRRKLFNKSNLFFYFYFNRLKSTEKSRKFISLNLSFSADQLTAMSILLVF